MINAGLYDDRDPRLDAVPDELHRASIRSAP
jgi:hypothetical protein